MESAIHIQRERGDTSASAPAPIVVATDGMAQSDGALAVARALARSLGTTAQVLAVQRDLSLVVPQASMLLEPSVLTALNRELDIRVRKQCADLSDDGGGASLANPLVEVGDPERVISRIAGDRGAQLVVMGIGRHDVADRIFGTETALKVARLSRAPVLAVPSALRTAPRRVVVGIDFSDASLDAAKSAIHLLADGGTVHLVHVEPRERALLDPWMSEEEYAEQVSDQFVRFRGRLIVPPNVRLEDETRTGDAARALIASARENRAELLAAGSHGHGFLTRAVLGSVTAALLRASTCAVLVVPPTRRPIGGSDATRQDVSAEALA